MQQIMEDNTVRLFFNAAVHPGSEEVESFWGKPGEDSVVLHHQGHCCSFWDYVFRLTGFSSQRERK